MLREFDSAAAKREEELELQVSFQRKNPDFLLKNPDFLFRNPDFLLKNVDFIMKHQAEAAKRQADANLIRMVHRHNKEMARNYTSTLQL